MNKPIKISGELLGRNTLFNFIGQVIPMLVGVVTIPIIVRGLGTERFGLLSLAWVILGYFSIFDLGLGRATTKFVAEALGKGEEEEIPYLVWTTVTVQVILGIVGGLVLVGITPILANHILDISPELIEEAKATFYLLALSVPVVFIYSSFSGVLEAKQRFELINGAKMIIASLTFNIDGKNNGIDGHCYNEFSSNARVKKICMRFYSHSSPIFIWWLGYNNKHYKPYSGISRSVPNRLTSNNGCSYILCSTF
jgi:hypothetical protein